jgi:hypothetical protein
MTGPHPAVSTAPSMFWKINTFGEEAFLAKAVKALDSFA